MAGLFLSPSGPLPAGFLGNARVIASFIGKGNCIEVSAISLESCATLSLGSPNRKRYSQCRKMEYPTLFECGRMFPFGTSIEYARIGGQC